MKFAAHSVCTLSYSIPESMQKMKQYGYDGFEINIGHPVNGLEDWKEYLATLDPAQLKQWMEEFDVEIPSLCLGSLWYVNIASKDAAERELGITIIKDSLALAGKLGCHCILIPVGDQPDIALEDARKHLYNSLGACLAAAKENGVILAIENVNQKILKNANDLADLVDRLDSPWCGVYFDIGNPIYDSMDPVQELNTLGKRIVQLHGKDVRPRKADEPWPAPSAPVFHGDTAIWAPFVGVVAGEGSVDQAAVAQAVKQLGFDGYMSMEVRQDPGDLDGSIRDNIRVLKPLYV